MPETMLRCGRFRRAEAGGLHPRFCVWAASANVQWRLLTKPGPDRAKPIRLQPRRFSSPRGIRN